MRLAAVSAIILSSLTLSGCASNAGPESLAVGLPSQETTSSVVRPAAPVPAADVGEAAPPTVPQQEVLAWAGSIPQPQAVVTAPGTAGMPTPAERPTAFLTPAAPAIDPSPRTRAQIYSHRFRDANQSISAPPRHGSLPCTASMFRAGRAASTGRSCGRRARTSPTSRQPMAATILIRCSERTGATPRTPG